MNYLFRENVYQGETSEVSDHTSNEICGQPRLWQDSWSAVLDQKESIKRFLREVLVNQELSIILTGAGTSAFIGESLVGTFQRTTGQTTQAIATTDLVSHPGMFLQKNKPTLMISFARSGNSPESVAAVDLATSFCNRVHHLIITCNPSGELATNFIEKNNYLFVLPPESHDEALAMTGSYTSMLLAGLLIARIEEIENLEPQVGLLSQYGEDILKNYASHLSEVAQLDFERAVFLGSGPLFGTAHESHLKLQELTDGRVICKYDSFLGIRHGPKAVIDRNTLLVYLFSNSPYVRQYELDLVSEINRGEKGLYSIGVSESDRSCQVDLRIAMGPFDNHIEEELLPVCSVLPAQILGYYKSLQLGLDPDQPSARGAISRVVKGVTIYPYHGR